MRVGTCTRTCSPGVEYYREGHEYLVDESDPLIARCFSFPALPDEMPAALEQPDAGPPPAPSNPEPPLPKRRGRPRSQAAL